MHVPARTSRFTKLTRRGLSACVALGLAMTIGFGAAAQIRAQSAASPIPTMVESATMLTAIPPRIGEDGTLKLKPGEKKQVALKVKNTSQNTVQVSSVAEDFIIDEDGKTPVPISETVSNRWSLSSWLTIAPSSQLVKPQETVAVNVLIEVPADALPGGHYAMVLHQLDNGGLILDAATRLTQTDQPVPVSGDPQSASGVRQRVGTLLYVIVDGAINEEAFIREFQLPGFTEMGPVPYSFTVENMSDVHIRPAFGLEIFDFLGRRVDSIQPEVKNIFPLTNRDFSGNWERVWGTGYYTARLTMSFGQTGQVVVAKTSFWLFPLKLVISLVVVLLAILAGGIAVRRHMIHRRANQDQLIQSLQDKVSRLESDKLKDFED